MTWRIALCACAGATAGGCGVGSPPPPFTDVSAVSGVDFVHHNGMTGEFFFAEMMGGGVAVLDFDGDDDLDLFFVQGQALSDAGAGSVRHRLYRNDGDLRFVDVSEQANLVAAGYAMGAAVGDVNNDGRPDIYVTAFGDNSLWLNRGAGRFENATAAASANDERWSVSASFFDYDGDGLLDLYVGNYVDYRLTNHKPCRSTTSRRDYCSPKVYTPQPDRLLRNGGLDAKGRPAFEDVSRAAGITASAGGALGVVAADFDGDERVDVYVANDGVPNLLWRNRGDGRFDDVAAVSGVAVNMTGAPEASMGLDAADFDSDGDWDLFMTHLDRESNTLYVNDGAGSFDDRSSLAGLAGSSLAYTGFGTRWFDFDGDGDLDLFSANGAVTQIQALIDAGQRFPLGQTNQLYENRQGRYVDLSAQAGPALAARGVGRGLAVADLDDDGDLDVVVANNNSAPQILRNELNPGAWVGIRALRSRTGRYASGSSVVVARDERSLRRRVRRDGSYASSGDPRISFVLADGTQEVDVSVEWYGAGTWRGRLQANRYHIVVMEATP